MSIGNIKNIGIIIKIMFVWVSGLCKFFWTKVVVLKMLNTDMCVA